MDSIVSLPLFQGLPEEYFDRIRESIVERRYPKGSILFVEGQVSDGLYVITRGLVKVFKIHRDGREKTLAILGEGDLVGEMSLFGTELRSATVKALETTTVLVIQKDKFRKLLKEIPELSFRVIELLSERLRQANEQTAELIFLNARSRLIEILVKLAKDRGKREPDGIRISIKLTHAELANLAGVSRETVTKVLAQLQDKKLIETAGKQIKIFNLDELNQKT